MAGREGTPPKASRRARRGVATRVPPPPPARPPSLSPGARLPNWEGNGSGGPGAGGGAPATPRAVGGPAGLGLGGLAFVWRRRPLLSGVLRGPAASLSPSEVFTGGSVRALRSGRGAGGRTRLVASCWTPFLYLRRLYPYFVKLWSSVGLYFFFF